MPLWGMRINNMEKIGRDELIKRTSRLERSPQPPPLEEIEALLTESAAVMLGLKAEIIRTQRNLEEALQRRSPGAADLDTHRAEMLRECEGVKAVACRLRSLHRDTLLRMSADAA